MTDSEIERLAAEYIAADWTPDHYYRDMNVIAFASKLLEHGYADGRKDERECWVPVIAAFRVADAAWCELASTKLQQDDRIEAFEWTEMQKLRAAIAKAQDSDVAEAMREVGRRIGH